MKRGPFSNQGTLICPPFLRQVRVPGLDVRCKCGTFRDVVDKSCGTGKNYDKTSVYKCELTMLR